MGDRRTFIRNMGLASVSLGLPGSVTKMNLKREKIRIGLVTYQWGKDWDLPAIIKNCTDSGVLGVELRVDHKHGVDTFLTSRQRDTVRKQFENSPVTFVGFGSNVEFHQADQNTVRLNIRRAKALLALVYDLGGSGVKVKPNGFVKGIPHEQTIEQIGRSLNELGVFAAELGLKVRLEVHGPETQEVPNIHSILEVADHPNVGICWNCNPTDLNGRGFQYNFNLVKDRFGDTIHIHEMDGSVDYPFRELYNNLVAMNYSGWCLLECSATNPDDKVSAMKKQRLLWEEMMQRAGA